MDLSGSLPPHGEVSPDVAVSAWVPPGPFVVGDVRLAEDSSVWCGARTDVQDGSIFHADPGYPATVGGGCVVGHNAVVHGCEVGDGCLIGMGVTILTGAKMGEGSIAAAGAVAPENREFPPRSLIVGVPAKQVGEGTDEQARDIELGGREYVERAAAHWESLGVDVR